MVHRIAHPLINASFGGEDNKPQCAQIEGLALNHGVKIEKIHQAEHASTIAMSCH